MLSIAICEDSLIDNQLLTAIIKGIDEEKKSDYVIRSYYSPEEMLEEIKVTPIDIDIAFLDIVMEPINGIELAKALRKTYEDMDIVFISATKEYALEGYGVRATNYLLKPYNREEIQCLLETCRNKKVKKYRVSHKPLLVNSGDAAFLLYESEIEYVESKNKQLTIHTSEQGCIVVKQKLNDFYMLLEGNNFLKTHRSFLVNMDYICGIEKYHFLLYSGDEVDITKRDYFHYKKQWEAYVEEKRDTYFK